MALPLSQSSLPVAASSAYKTALEDCRARCAAVSLASLERNSPLASAKTTPLTIAGVRGEIISRETQPRCNVGAPFCSTTLKATIAPFLTSPFDAENPDPVGTEPPAGASTHRVPAASCQLASAPVAKSVLEKVSVVLSAGPAN